MATSDKPDVILDLNGGKFKHGALYLMAEELRLQKFMKLKITIGSPHAVYSQKETGWDSAHAGPNITFLETTLGSATMEEVVLWGQ
eukprot:15335180-Ditylum_brightwellii.AAC.1